MMSKSLTYAYAEGGPVNEGLTFGGGGGRSGDGRPDSTVYNPNQITSVRQGGLGFSGNPEHFRTTPRYTPEQLAQMQESITTYQPPAVRSYQAAPTYDEFYQLPDRQPTAPAPDYNLGMGDVASAFSPSSFDSNAPPPQTYDVMVPSTTAGMYVPPTQQGLGSFSNSVFDGYLMYSNPIMEEFIRPTGG